MIPRAVRVPSVALAAVLILGACGSDTKPSASSGAPTDVVASFYPLQYVTERVGGDRVKVTNLTPPGAEPHDVELTPQDVKHVEDAQLVVYLEGFSPAVDSAVDQGAKDSAFEVGQYADLSLTYTPIEEGTLAEDEKDSTDPHFWLDPTRLAAVADQIAQKLGALDPKGAATFTANAAALRADLEALDGEMTAGLVSCESKDLVTSHNAFGYLAKRYGLEQVGITGLTPEDEPTPQSLAEVAQFVRDNAVRTIYYETLISPAIAKTIAAEAGVATAVLDPIEGLGDASQGRDYLAIMRANLANLQRGQPCP